MLHRVVLVRIDISVEHIASIIRAERISKLGTTLAVTSNQSMLQRSTKLILSTVMMDAICSSKTSVPTRATWFNSAIMDHQQIL
jgi:hypothetical protein